MADNNKTETAQIGLHPQIDDFGNFLDAERRVIGLVQDADMTQEKRSRPCRPHMAFAAFDLVPKPCKTRHFGIAARGGIRIDPFLNT